MPTLRIPILLFALALFLSTASIAASAERWTRPAGQITLEWNAQNVAGAGLTIEGSVEHATDPGSDFGAVAIIDSLQYLEGASLDFLSGLTITSDTGYGATLESLSLTPVFPDSFEMRDGSGNVLFHLEYAHTRFVAAEGHLFMMNMDIFISPFLAEQVGRPGFARSFAGTAHLSCDLLPEPTKIGNVEDGAATCVVNHGPAIDAALIKLNSLSQLARQNGVRVAVAPSADIGNLGSNDIRWEWAISPLGFAGPLIGPHPFLVMHMYRIHDGRIRLIGQSDVKHAFYAVNSGCPCAGGQILYVGCEDRYGVGNNGDQFFFGPRQELSALSGIWSSQGSHFDNYLAPSNELNDNVRSHDDGAGAHDNFEHRLTVSESDLQVSNASYFVEAWYLVAGDTNIFNSIGSIGVSPTLGPSTWSFPPTATLRNGSVLDRWVNPTNSGDNATNVLMDTGGGHFGLAVQVSSNAGWNFHYEYAMMNFDFDQQVAALCVPLPLGTTVTNVEFFDADTDGLNQWVVTVSSNELKWTASVSNALDWGTLYNFSFDANASPASAFAAVNELEAGVASNLVIQTLAPFEPDTDGDGIPNSTDGDDDGDGISDDFEAQHQLDGLNPNDATNNPDEDAFNNLEEYIANTDPNSATSEWRVDSIQIMSPPEISWSGSAERVYSVQFNTGLVAGIWHDLRTNIFGSNAVMSFSDTNALPTKKNYRIEVGIPDE